MPRDAWYNYRTGRATVIYFDLTQGRNRFRTYNKDDPMDMNDEQLLPLLRKVTIFAGLADAGLKRIVSDCNTMKYAAGRTIIRQGTPATEIYIVLEGTVKVILDMDEYPLEICEFSTGNCLGEASIIGITSHSASVTAVTDATLLVLTRKTLMHLFETDKEFFAMLILNIARELARRLHKTDELLLEYARKARR